MTPPLWTRIQNKYQRSLLFKITLSPPKVMRPFLMGRHIHTIQTYHEHSLLELKVDAIALTITSIHIKKDGKKINASCLIDDNNSSNSPLILNDYFRTPSMQKNSFF